MILGAKAQAFHACMNMPEFEPRQNMSMETGRLECECFSELREPAGRSNSGSIIKFQGQALSACRIKPEVGTRLKHEHGNR